MRLSAALAHLSHQDYRQLDAGCLGVKLERDRSWPHIFRTIRLQQRDHPFRYSLCFPSVSIMALCRNVLQEDDILCRLYVDTYSDISDYSDTECLDSDSDVQTTSSHKQLRSCTGSLTPQFPHLFFLTLWVGTASYPFGRPGILVTTASKHRIQGTYSKFGTCRNILYRILVSIQPKTRTVTGWSEDVMAGSPEIEDIQSRENNRIWRVGENGVWGGIGLYLQRGDILSWGKEVGGHSVITFRQKLRPKSSHLSRQFL
jgi:hypothetical protein